MRSGRAPTQFAAPRKQDVNASIEECINNAKRLVDDAEYLEFQDSGATRLALSFLAQEECSKAFLLYMIREEMIPWDADVLRIIRNHSCKHLIALVIDYVEPEWEDIEEIKAIIDAEYELGGRFPKKISSALNILYFEKIENGNFLDDSDYDRDVEDIAKGKIDCIKQNAIYVDIDKSCRAKNLPRVILQEDAEREQRKAEHYISAVRRLVGPNAYEGVQLSKLRKAVKAVYWQRYKRQMGNPPE